MSKQLNTASVEGERSKNHIKLQVTWGRIIARCTLSWITSKISKIAAAAAAAVTAKSLQSCLTLCDPTEGITILSREKSQLKSRHIYETQIFQFLFFIYFL